MASVMVIFVCQLDWATGEPMSVFLDDINISVNRLSKGDFPTKMWVGLIQSIEGQQ